MNLKIHMVTLFPSLFSSWLEQGVVSRAIRDEYIELDMVNLREFGVGKHRIVDDYPFGGGAGMVLKPEPLYAAIESVQAGEDVPVVLLSPSGRVFSQRIAAEFASEPQMVLVSGHYEGVDERVRSVITDELSLGDYVISAGELAAMVVVDAIARLVPGVLTPESLHEESFSDGLLEYPQYTRPATFRGIGVPPVLLSGHHGEVQRWREQEARRITRQRRPDLLPDDSDGDRVT